MLAFAVFWIAIHAFVSAAGATGIGLEVGYDPFDLPTTPSAEARSTPLRQSPEYDPFEALSRETPPGKAPSGILSNHAALWEVTNDSGQPLSPFQTPIFAIHTTAGDSTEPSYRFVAQWEEQLPIAPSDGKSGSNAPCAGVAEKPLGDLTINTAMPSGDFPTDFAAACWQHIDSQAGPLAGARFWPLFAYHWNATGFCHRPLYLEEVNLERYGYGCCACLQPAVSAAHFFGTVPALPYCMATHCPGECVYTLGHYRPGSCPPWQTHWPECVDVTGNE